MVELSAHSNPIRCKTAMQANTAVTTAMPVAPIPWAARELTAQAAWSITVGTTGKPYVGESSVQSCTGMRRVGIDNQVVTAARSLAESPCAKHISKASRKAKTQLEIAPCHAVMQRNTGPTRKHIHT